MPCRPGRWSRKVPSCSMAFGHGKPMIQRADFSTLMACFHGMRVRFEKPPPWSADCFRLELTGHQLSDGRQGV